MILKKKAEKINSDALEKVNGGVIVDKPNPQGGNSYFIVDDNTGNILDISSRSKVAETIAKENDMSTEHITTDDYIKKFNKDFSLS